MIPFKKIIIKSKAGLVLFNYSHAILDEEIQNNGGCPEAIDPDRGRPLQPRKYQKSPHRSWLGNWLWALIMKIQGYCYLKYREYLQELYSLDTWCLTEQTNVLRSDTTSNRINHTACNIWPTMLYISCALINSTLKTSSISTNSWSPELFKTLQETSYILLGVQINLSFMIHLIHTWYFESFWQYHQH